MKILIEDRDKMQPDEFSALHDTFIGSSTIATLAGLNPFASPLDEWLIRTGRKKREDISEKAHIKHGHRMEPVIGAMFQEEKGGGKVLPCKQVQQHDSLEWAIASPDFYYWEDRAALAPDIVEAKNYGWWAKDHFADGGIPDIAACQLQWQLGVNREVSGGYLAALVGGDASHFYTPLIHRSDEVFEQLVELAEKFLKLVKEDTPPEAGKSDSANLNYLYRHNVEEIKPLQDDTHELIEKFNAAKDRSAELGKQVRELEAEKKELQNRIRSRLGNSNAGRCGKYIVTCNIKEVDIKARTDQRVYFRVRTI